MTDERERTEGPGTAAESPFRYHLELTPAQLKITHTALRSLLDDFGHEEREVIAIIHEVLGKLPDEHTLRGVALERESSYGSRSEEPPSDGTPPPAA